MKTATKIAIGLGAAAGAAALGYLGVKCLVDLTARREVPFGNERFTEKVAQAEERSPYADTLKASRAWLEAQSPEIVQVESFDGLHLVGHLLTVPDAVRTIVYLHGWRERWNSNLGLVAKFLTEHHTNVLLPEQRAQGESEGAYMGLGVLERRDLQAWADYAAMRFPELPLYLGGVSMGATSCLMASELPLPASVRGIIADSGFTSPKAILSHVITSRTVLPDRPLVPLANQVSRLCAGYAFDDCSTIDALRNNLRIPVLFVHGDADQLVPLAMTLENYLACSAPKELLIVEGAGHGMSYLVDQSACEDALLRFFAAHDRA